MNMRFYLAAPFFNDEQKATLSVIEDTSEKLGIECFSPRKVFVCPPNADQETRKRTFQGNLDGICGSDFVLARIDDFDPGTVWELGYAFRHKQLTDESMPLKVYAFTTVPGRGLNLMLACGVDGFLVGMESVQKFLREMAEDDNDGEAKKWFGQVQ